MNFFPPLGSDSCETNGTSKAASARLQDKGICGAWRGVSHRPSGMADHGAFWSAEVCCILQTTGLLTFFSPSLPHSSDDFSLRSRFSFGVPLALFSRAAAHPEPRPTENSMTFRRMGEAPPPPSKRWFLATVQVQTARQVWPLPGIPPVETTISTESFF